MNSINQLTQNWAEQNTITSFFKDDTDSTNIWAKSDFKKEEFAIYLTDHQTQGRGRNQNTWTNSSAGSTLLSTWCLRLDAAPQPIFPLRVGLALYEAFRFTWTEIPWALKAPNDIYLNNCKLAGILIEADNVGSQYRVFIGVGANIFSSPLVDQPTSFLLEHTSFSEEDWFKFCFIFSTSLRLLQKDPQRQNLLLEEQEKLTTALRHYKDNPIASLEKDGSLILKNGLKTHWSAI